MKGIDEETFLHGLRCNYFIDNWHFARWGIHSFSSREAMESLAFRPNPSNWPGSVRTIVNYFTWKALQRYGFHEEVVVVTDKRISSLVSDISRTFLSIQGLHRPEFADIGNDLIGNRRFCVPAHLSGRFEFSRKPSTNHFDKNS
jgi:hypothetical protein